MTAETPNTTLPEPLPDRWGVVANYDGDSYVSAGALCWLASVNGSAERYEFVVQSRGGRLIRRYMERAALTANQRQILHDMSRCGCPLIRLEAQGHWVTRQGSRWSDDDCMPLVEAGYAKLVSIDGEHGEAYVISAALREEQHG
ncbi:hypothetical protein TSA6c_00445 [Azospirillum sp. TSA6c]|uniref:hypothetical protein n=1 Tax=Azospirillum sp. TSA6c TaxID=709813 RepID=UPI000D61C020|nr:hypothetical protein [Azospirillum sp. TSA6c]PWC54370.1 hypothetical protein TSA6c_00445 [Azospirillum sp. TSA6c]